MVIGISGGLMLLIGMRRMWEELEARISFLMGITGIPDILTPLGFGKRKAGSFR